MAETSIEWTDATWNPVRGCTKISPGCTHCYAETFAERFRGVAGHPYEQGFDLRLVPEKLSGQEATSFYLGRFEVSFNQQQYDQAWEASDRIAAKYLFPNQLKWLEEMRQRLPRRTAAK